MSGKKVLIIGSSGQAKLAIDIFERTNIDIMGLIDDYRSLDETTLGYHVLGKVEDIPSMLEQFDGCKAFIAIGDNYGRYLVSEKIKRMAPRIEFLSAVHPSASIGKNVRSGHGVSIMAGAIVSPNAHIGNFTIINTKASAAHDIQMHDFSSLAPAVTTGGNVTIGKLSAISIGATIREKLTIGEHSIIGAGSLLLSDCPDHVVMCGVPARVIRERRPGDKYV